MNLLWFNLAMDQDDAALAFAVDWVAAVARHVEQLTVITMRLGRVQVPENVSVYSLGKERGVGEPRRLFELYRLLFVLGRRDRFDVCFSHMTPIFTALAGPVLRLWGVPVLTWYAHPSLTLTLKVAHLLSTNMVSSLPTAYPYSKDKLLVTGQGIDTAHFSISPATVKDEPPLILSVGRLAPVKDQHTLLEAVALVRESWHGPFRVVLIGATARSGHDAYARGLEARVDSLGLQDIVTFRGSVPLSELPTWYRRATVHVNLTPSGFGDKVALEAMACGTLSLAANEGFRETFGKYADSLLFRFGEADHLARRIEWALRLDAGEREVIGSDLRAEVIHRHGLPRLASQLVAALQAAKSSA